MRTTVRAVLLHLLLLTCVFPIAARAAETAETWLFSSTDGWTASAGTSISATSGYLHTVFATGGGIYTSVINYIPGSDTFHRDYIRFAYQIPSGSFTQLKFNFSTSTRANFSSTDYFLTGLIKDGNWHWVTYRVDNIGDWKTASRITQLRLVATVAGGGGASGTLNMDFFVMREDDKLPQTYTCDRGTNVVGVSPPGWTSGAIDVTVRANDPGPYLFPECGPTPPDEYGSGVASFRYTVNGVTTTQSFDNQDGQWPTGWSQAVLTIPAGSLATGAHTFSVHALDRVGFQATTNATTTVYYDGTAPNTPSIASVTPSGWSIGNSFTFSWNNPGDVGSGVHGWQYLIDGYDGPYDVSTTSITLAASSVGHHFLQVRAIDNVGLASGYSGPADFYLDNAPPATPAGLSASPSGLTNLNSFTMTWAAVADAGSGTRGYDYQINGGAIGFTTGTSVSGALATRSGTNSFAVRARDYVDQVSGWTSTTFTWDPNYIPAPDVASPADGVALALPEIFSWSPRQGATGYELQIAPGGNFAGPTWTGETSLTSLTIPSAAAPQTINYGWRIRSLGPSSPVAWGPVRSFTRVSAVGPPGTPALAFPPDGSTQDAGDVTFQWTSAANASSYRLEVSTDPAFPASSAGAFVRDGLTGTLCTLRLDSPGTTLYWRVTAKNSSGFGTRSGTAHLVLAALPPSISGVLISAPSADLSTDQGGSIQATGLVVGRYAGSVAVDWLLDDEVFSSSTVVLDGTGRDLDAVSVPTATVGVHQLVLRVTGNAVVTSPARIIQITSPGVGPADHLVVVADTPQILANTATTLYCTVRDAEGSIVLADNGRTVSFDGDSDSGVISPATATTAAGLALTTYTAPADDAELTVTATSGDPGPSARASSATAIRNDKVSVGSSLTSLALEKKVAFAYLDRVSRLPLDGIDGAFPSAPVLAPWPTISIGNAWSFVNGAHPGDVARLHRLNIYLRYLDRAYFYDVSVDKLGKMETGPIPGVATMEFDLANACGKLALTVFEVVGDLRGPISSGKQAWWKKIYAPILDLLYRQLVTTFDKLGQTIINFGCRTPALKNDMLGIWSQALNVSDKYVNSHSELGITGLWAQGTVTNTIAATALRSRYVNPLQGQLNQVVNTLRSGQWSGGSDGPSEAAVATALQQIRARTDYQHRWFSAADDALNGNFVQGLESAADVVAHLGPGYMKYFQKILFAIVKNAILLASGIDCYTTSTMISYEQAPAVAAIITANGGAAPTQTQLYAMMSLRDLVAPRSPGEPLSARVVTGVNDVMNTSLANYESIIHDLEQKILAADTSGTQVVVSEIADAERLLRDAASNSAGPLFATFEDARLAVDDHTSNIDSLTALLDGAALSRSRGIAAVADWLTTSSDLGLRDQALAQIRGGLDTTRTSFDAVGAALSIALGKAAVPFINLTSPQLAVQIFYGDSTSVQVTATNLGGGTSQYVRLRLVESPDLVLESPPTVELGGLEPGQSAVAHWRLRFYPALVDTSTTAVASFSVVVDSTDAGIGSSLVGSLLVIPSGGLADVPDAPPNSGLRLVVGPNPSHGTIRLDLSAGNAGPGILEIIDVTGRRVAVVARWAAGHAPTHLMWSGATEGGRRASTGVYFARLKTAEGTRVVRVVRIE